MEKLIGNAYKSSYTTSEFQKEYEEYYENHKVPSLFPPSQLLQGRSKLANTVLSAVTGRSRGGSALSRQATEPIILGNFSNSTNDTHNLSESMAAVPSGTKALNNHLLWRSNYRRDVSLPDKTDYRASFRITPYRCTHLNWPRSPTR